MVNKRFVLLLLSLTIWLICGQSVAQSDLPDGPDRKESRQTSIPPFQKYNFPNVNKVLYHYDAAAIKKMSELDDKEQWEKLYKRMGDYVQQFGIENFYKDTRLLWRYAKLTEIFGDPEDARFLYRLVLKHHHNAIDLRQIELYYDSLTANEADYYVPLDYYYELVEYRKAVDTLVPPRGVLVNMGEGINSPAADYAPALGGKNDEYLLFTSSRNIHERKLSRILNEDIFLSRHSDGIWEDAEPLEFINSKYNEGSACISPDGRTLIFSRCGSPGGFGDCDLWMASLQFDSTWGFIENMGPNVNSLAWDSQPTLSHTGDTLYFASDRIGGFGLSDIYMTRRNEDGTWSPAINLGPVVNTRDNDLSPFYHPKFNILYFSSNGHLLNFGQTDIYKSTRRQGIWTEPINIGPLVNGPGNEFYFSIDAAAENLYYAYTADSSLNNLDLFSFPLPMSAKPDAVTTVTGRLTDTETDEPFKGIVSIIDVDSGVEIAPKFLRPDGTFEFKLINKRNYLLVLQGEEFFRIEEIFFLDGDMNFDRKTEHIASRMKFTSIEFEHGNADLLPGMFGDLDKIVNFLLDHPEFSLRIGGHTDSQGDAGFNLDLSERRAQAIRDYLVQFGNIAPERVQAKGYGNTQPIVSDDNEEAHQINRRVEFEIYRSED